MIFHNFYRLRIQIGCCRRTGPLLPCLGLEDMNHVGGICSSKGWVGLGFQKRTCLTKITDVSCAQWDAFDPEDILSSLLLHSCRGFLLSYILLHSCSYSNCRLFVSQEDNLKVDVPFHSWTSSSWLLMLWFTSMTPCILLIPSLLRIWGAQNTLVWVWFSGLLTCLS